ncbi:preprotein translocase subunit SecY [Ochrobactrum cytisi]|nr:preprotein translocase subunit SecY [Brucella cytisi]
MILVRPPTHEYVLASCCSDINGSCSYPDRVANSFTRHRYICPRRADDLFPNGSLIRFSVVALGIMPLFTVFVYAEIAKLVFPSFFRWQVASPDNAFHTSIVIKAMILLVAAMQGYGFTSALADMGLMKDSPGAVVTGVVSLVGTSAVMIWLASVAHVPYRGNGFWLLLAVSLICAVPADFIRALDLTRVGAVSIRDWLIAILSIVLAVAAIVVANLLLCGKKGDAGAEFSLTVLLWPPFLANIVAGYLLLIPVLFIPDLFAGAPRQLILVSLISSAILIPVFVYAYYRLISSVRPEFAGNETRSVMLMVAGIQILVCTGLGIVDYISDFPIIPDGGMLIVCVTVLLALRWSAGGKPAFQT